MKFFIYDLQTKENTLSIVEAILKDIQTNTFKVQNARSIQSDKSIIRFNIVSNIEFDSVLSKELWFKLNQGFVVTESNLLLINEFQHESLIEKLKREFFTLFQFEITPKGCDRDFLNQVLEDKSNYVNEISFIDEDGELRKESMNFDIILYEDISLLEVSYFDKHNSLVRYTAEGVFFCQDEELLYKNLGNFKNL